MIRPSDSSPVPTCCVDREFIRDRLNECVRWPDERQISRVGIRRLLPGRGSRLEIEYRITLNGDKAQPDRHFSLYACFPPLDPPADGENRMAGLSDRGPADLFFTDPESRLTFHSMDRDPALDQVERCFDSAFMSERLASSAKRQDYVCQPLAYRRGKRLVVRFQPTPIDATHPGFVGKCYVDDRGAQLTDRQQQLSEHLARTTDGRVNSLPPLFYDAELRMVVTKWMEPSPVGDVSCPAEWHARRAAETLVAVHSAPLSDLRHFSITDEWAILERWCATVIALRPIDPAPAASLIEALRVAQECVGHSEPVVVHRDFYESQIIVGDEKTTVLDLDTLARGDRCIDIGNYLAHQWLWSLERGLGVPEYAKSVQSMLERYESGAGSVDRASLSFHWASALFRIGAIHSFRDATRQHVAALWDMIPSVLKWGRDSAECAAVSAIELSSGEAT